MSYEEPNPHQYMQYRIDLPTPTQRSGRRKAAHSKVRTGCDNCKQRRIKCDETRPSCLRCARSKLVCRGYHPPEAKLFELNADTSTFTSGRAEQESQERDAPHQTDNGTTSKSSKQDYASTFHSIGENEVNKPSRSQVRLLCQPRIHHSAPPCRRDALTTQVAARNPKDSRDVVEDGRDPNATYSADLLKVRYQVKPLTLDAGRIHRPLQMWACADVETTALHFYFEKTLSLPKFCSKSADVFFTTIVPQMLFHESAVKHQVIALGLAHRRSLTPSNSAISIDLAKNYGYALRSLANNPRIESHVLLSSCLLFLAIEMLCDGPKSALNHLKSGLRMLRDEEITSRSGESTRAHISQHLEPIFAQLAMTSSTTGPLSLGRLTNSSRRPPDLSQSFKSIEEANMKFLELVQWTEYGCADLDISGSAAWQAWHEHLQTFQSQMDDDAPLSQLQGKLLHAHTMMVRFRAEHRNTGDEMSWDQHVPEYRKQLDECFAPFIRLGYPAIRRYDTFGQAKLPGFDLPPGFFPPLWQVSTICRDPDVRRQAIELLRIHHERAGHDEECYGVLAAIAVMHLEERDLEKVKTSSDIPIHKRVRLHEVLPDSAGFLRCTISRWPFKHTEPLLVPCGKTSGYSSSFVCSCKSFGIL